MDVKVFEVKEYMIIWRQLELMNFNGIAVRVRAIVRLTGGEYTMDVHFVDDDATVPDPFFDVPNKKGYMFLNIRDILAFVDMVRNERPVYGHLRGDRPDWMSVTTAKEPIGEGEG